MNKKRKMSLTEHKKRHVELHRSLDELIADFISQTGKMPSETNLLTLMIWSFEQTQNPTEFKTDKQ